MRKLTEEVENITTILEHGPLEHHQGQCHGRPVQCSTAGYITSTFITTSGRQPPPSSRGIKKSVELLVHGKLDRKETSGHLTRPTSSTLGGTLRHVVLVGNQEWRHVVSKACIHVDNYSLDSDNHLLQ